MNNTTNNTTIEHGPTEPRFESSRVITQRVTGDETMTLRAV